MPGHENACKRLKDRGHTWKNGQKTPKTTFLACFLGFLAKFMILKWWVGLIIDLNSIADIILKRIFHEQKTWEISPYIDAVQAKYKAEAKMNHTNAIYTKNGTYHQTSVKI